MTLLVKGNELIATEALSAKVLLGLVDLAVRRPLIINGVELSAGDLAQLAEAAQRSEQPISLNSAIAIDVLQKDSQRREGGNFFSPAAPESTPPALVIFDECSQRTQPFAGSSKSMLEAHQRKVLAHAAAKLVTITTTMQQAQPEKVAPQLRSFLKVEEARLRIAHRLGASGRWTAAARSYVLDVFVKHLFQAAAVQPGMESNSNISSSDSPGMIQLGGGPQWECAVVAIGGYGRAELAPFSDLDLLFLYSGRRSATAALTRELVERMLHLLWDAGLNVGHRYHTIEECVAAARTDLHLQTALTTTRLVAGESSLLDRLANLLDRERGRFADEFILNLQHKQAEQSSGRRGAPICLQEPNVKESAGGLRDLHAALWAAHARHGYHTLEELRAHGIIAEDERLRAEQSYDFLLRVRQAAHWLTNRKTDRLTLDLQPALAEEFGYVSSRHLQASEGFMRDYYRRARQLHSFSQSLIARVKKPAAKKPAAKKSAVKGRSVSSRAIRPRQLEEQREKFSIRDKELHLEGSARLFTENPLLFFEAFALAQAADVPLCHELGEAMHRKLAAIDTEFRQSVEAARRFLELLRRPGRVGRTLRLMDEVGFLSRYLPEYGRISMLIQHDLYHRYTIDEHTLRAVEALDELAINGDKADAPLQAAFDEVEDKALLYLAVVLHDLGKGRGSGHVARGSEIAKQVTGRLHLDDANESKVVLLVKQHLVMAHISQRRDLSEPRLAADFAHRDVQTLDALNMLLLLTYADMNGVGPGVWSEWKGALLLELYRRTRVHLTDANDSSSTSSSNIDDDAESSRSALYSLSAVAAEAVTKKLKEQVAALLSGELSLSEVEHHFRLLPNRYARTVNAEAAAMHLRMVAQLKTKPLVWRWRTPTGATTELTLCTLDRQGLFADVAGALASQGIEILSADLNTRADGIAVDTLILREAAGQMSVEKHRWARIERTLQAAIAEEYDVAAHVERWRTRNAPRRSKAHARMRRHPLAAPPHVTCDNEAAEATTVIEVRAPDEPGFAYKIASLLATFNLNIVCARITTEKSDALDAFYVTNAAGSKLSETELHGVEETLIKSLAVTMNNETTNTAGAAAATTMARPSAPAQSGSEVSAR